MTHRDNARVRGPLVYRNVSAGWEIEQQWGPTFGDVHKYSITKNPDNNRVTVNGLGKNSSLPAGVARQIGEALIAAADWSDDSVSDDGTDEASDLDTSKVTRVEVINETGRAFVQGPNPEMESLVEAVLQDEGRTLKVFINLPFDKSRAIELTDTERLSGVVEQGEEATGLKQDLRASGTGTDTLDRAREQEWPAEGGPVLKPYARAGVQAAQTRDNDGEILSWVSVTEAFEYAGPDEDVWKISFNDSDGRRVRLVRTTDEDGEVSWLYRPMEREIAEGLERERSSDREDESSSDQENPSTVVLPPGTVRRAPADGGYLLHRHAILLDGGVSSRRWHIVSLFGPEDSMRTDSDVAHWPIVYIPKPNDVWAQEES